MWNAALASPEVCRAVIEQLPATALMLDAGGAVTFCNRPPDGCTTLDVGRGVWDFVDPEFRAGFRLLLADALHSGRTTGFEFAAQLGSGGREWYLGRIGPLRTGGAIVGALVVLAPATRRAIESGTAFDDTVHDFLSVCAWCKKVRDGAGRWNALEDHLARHLGLAVSHGICPTCLTKHAGAMSPP